MFARNLILALLLVTPAFAEMPTSYVDCSKATEPCDVTTLKSSGVDLGSGRRLAPGTPLERERLPVGTQLERPPVSIQRPSIGTQLPGPGLH